MSAAGRQRRRRARRHRGERVARVPYGLAVVEMLVDQGMLSWAESNEPDCVDAAIAAFIGALADRDD